MHRRCNPPHHSRARSSIAGTGNTLEGVLVAISPLPTGLMVGDGMLASTMSVLTGADGRYHFAALAPGRYRLRIERIGYRATTLETEVRQPRDARIGVALELEPLAMRPLVVRERVTPPFRRVTLPGDDVPGARADLERRRQAEYLTPDSRVVTYADLTEA
jgi:hypothetical protein